MKIAILSPFFPYRGGIAQFSELLYRGLSGNNEVKAFSFTTLYPNFLFPGKSQYVPDNEYSDIESCRTLNSINPVSYIKTAKKINKYEPDILIISYWMPFMTPAYSSVCLLLNKQIKIVALVHNAIPHEKRVIDKPLTKLFFDRCDAFIVLSETVRKDVLSLCKGANIFLHPHPIYDNYGETIDKEQACDKLGIRSDKKNLLFFGLIREYKGLDLLIEAMDLLDDSFQLIISGESYGDFEKYNKLIQQSRLKDNIKVFEQYIPDNMVPTFFSATDVLVLPYRSATQSGVTAIAIQMELPIIATNVGELGNSVKDAQIGVVAPTATNTDIAKAILEFFSDEKKISIYKEKIEEEKKRLSWRSFIQFTESSLSGL